MSKSCNSNITLPIGPRGPQGPQGIQGPPGENGIGIEWLGEFTAAPENPTLNQAYYNSIDGISYIWNGSNWDILAKDGVEGPEGPPGPPGPGSDYEINIQEEGTTINTAPVTIINFTGSGATASEMMPGIVQVHIPGGDFEGVIHIDGPDAASDLGEQTTESERGLPAGTSIGVDDEPSTDIFIKGAALSDSSGRHYASSMPTNVADTTIILQETNTSTTNKKYLMLVNFTVEYNSTGAFPMLGNLRIYSAVINGPSITYKSGSAQNVGIKDEGIITSLVIPVAYMDVIEVAPGQTAAVCVDAPAINKTSTSNISVKTGNGTRITRFNSNIIQLN